MKTTDTIAAISTPLMTGAVGIVRVSGPESARILGVCFSAASGLAVEAIEPAKLVYGTFEADGFSDRCMAVLFRGPKSFTGEDMAEVQCHGGVEVVRGVLRKLLSAGARMAEPGEFTRRAFLNGKQDLSSCEGVGDMIHAESRAELAAAGRLERGDLFRRVRSHQDALTDLISYTEVMLDYPEEEIPPAERSDMLAKLQKIRDDLAALSASYETGRKIRDGVTVVLCGKTNAGKSSLFNALLAFDRAIVTDVPGTTRDTVEGCFETGGVKVRLVDTAGVRESEDVVERQGVRRSLEEISHADLLLFVLDERGQTREDEEILRRAAGVPAIFVRNKNDLSKRVGETSEGGAFADLSQHAREATGDGTAELDGSAPARAIPVSAATGENLVRLKSEILSRTVREGYASGLCITNERHFDALSRAEVSVRQTLLGFSEKTFDLLALEFRELWDILGEITGTSATEEIIDNIFKKFCLGK